MKDINRQFEYIDKEVVIKKIVSATSVVSLTTIRMLRRLRSHHHVAHVKIAVAQEVKAEEAAAVVHVSQRVVISDSLSTSVRQMVSIQAR